MKCIRITKVIMLYKKQRRISMEGLQYIGISICITAIVTSIFSMLVPDNHLDKVLKFAISLFFLTGIISPFANNKLNFRIEMEDIIDAPSSHELSASMENQFVTIASRNIEAQAEKILNKNNIFPKKIEIFINITEDDSISINKMMVYIKKDSGENQQTIKTLIKDEMGITPQILLVQ